ncbi:cytochrome P450 [Streptosporangium sp. NPDC002544]|uniref:cytochrome P450 n=1 Tax=Streptosporangium sp. NPDC002544 TaxID=3154538 RepID=UPI0033189C5A
MTAGSRADVLDEEAVLAHLATPEFNDDPTAVYRFFLAHPGWYSPSGYRVFARYDDVRTILRTADVFGQPGRKDGNFHTADPPEHTRLRKLVTHAFTFRAIKQQRDFISEVATELLDDIRPVGRMDLATDFGALLPGRVTAKLLGVDYQDGARWQSWLEAIKASRGVVHYLAPDPAEIERIDAAAAAAAAGTADYLAGLIRERRAGTGSDIISVLLSAKEGDDTLTEKELLYTLLLLLGAGLHTTSAQIATTMALLFAHPDVLERVRADPALVPAAVEEALRFDGALQAEYRVVRVATQIGGVELQPGEKVLIVVGAANRDAAKFADPDVFDLDRPNAKDHLTFGSGIHRCLGAELSRAELEIAVTQLLTTLPDLHAAGAAVRHHYNRWRGLASMPVAWSVRDGS